MSVDRSNIVLVGFMGTGKTLVGKSLARSTGLDYVSLDERIEQIERRTIKQIFSESGEGYFRELEKRVLRRELEKERRVIDTGGGVVLDRNNMDLMNERGVCICLWASLDEILKRTSGHGHRPLLNVPDPRRRISDLLSKRRPFYEKAPHHVDTTGKSVDDVVKEIRGIVDA